MKLGVHIGYWGLGLTREDQLEIVQTVVTEPVRQTEIAVRMNGDRPHELMVVLDTLVKKYIEGIDTAERASHDAVIGRLEVFEQRSAVGAVSRSSIWKSACFVGKSSTMDSTTVPLSRFSGNGLRHTR